MSEQYPGGFVAKTPPTPSGPYYNSTARGIWTLTQQAQLTVQGIWPTAGNNPPIYWIMTIAPPTTGDYTSINANSTSLKVDSSGNIYPSFSMGPAAGPYFAAWNISKIDINGNLIFTKSYTFGGEETGYLGNSIPDSSNNLFVSGATGTSPYLGFYAKYNSSGTATWNFQTVDTDIYLTNVAGDDSSGNRYYGGQDDTAGRGVWIKTNSSGDIQASKRVSSSRPYAYMDWGQVDSSGNYLGAGSTIYEGYLIKLNSSGGITWSSTLGTGYGGALACAVVDPTFSYIYAIAKEPSSSNWSLYKVDGSNGTTTTWSQYSSDFPYYSGHLACDSSGNIYVVTQPNSAPTVCTILKFNSSGTLQWQRNLTYTGANISPKSITIDSTNSVFILSIGQSSTPNRTVVIRLPTDGSQTGTYGSWAYAASSYTISSGAAGSWVGGGFSVSGSLTSATFTPTIAATAFTATTAKIT